MTEVEKLQEQYDLGFENGMKATLQQLDGLIHEGATPDELRGWLEEQWEGEGE